MLCSSVKVKEKMNFFQELYNENIRDLLNPGSGILDLMEDEKGNVQVPGLSKVIAPTSAKVSEPFHMPKGSFSLPIVFIFKNFLPSVLTRWRKRLRTTFVKHEHS